VRFASFFPLWYHFPEPPTPRELTLKTYLLVLPTARIIFLPSALGELLFASDSRASGYTSNFKCISPNLENPKPSTNKPTFLSKNFVPTFSPVACDGGLVSPQFYIGGLFPSGRESYNLDQHNPEEISM